MRCPNCGLVLPEGTFVCPGCATELGMTQKISLDKTMWCPSCGALAPSDAGACPSCGSPLSGAPVPTDPARPQRDIELPDIASDPDDAEIASAIPAVVDAQDAFTGRHERLPKTKSYLLAAVLAVVVVGGAILAIAHPWDPNARMTRATSPADTSTAGYPGQLQALTGQDGQDKSGEGDKTVESMLAESYATLGVLSQSIQDSEESLRTAVTNGGDLDDGYQNAVQISLDVSNLISELGQIQGADEFSDDIDHLVTLGSWLRNHAEVLESAWEAAADGEGREALSSLDAIEDDDHKSEYQRLFDANYEPWKPQER